MTETWVHIIRCPTEARKKWREKTLASIDTTCKDQKTDPHLRYLICSSVASWMELAVDNHTRFRVDPGEFPNAYCRLIEQQNRIGWEHIFQGWFSTEWSLLKDEFYANKLNNKPKQKMTGHSWQVPVEERWMVFLARCWS